MLKSSDTATVMTLRLRRSTVDTIARAAKKQKTTQKRVICTALAAAGLAIAPADLADHTPRRKPL